jgi:hybrid cluster-associated redox disulfide protein
MQDPNVLHRHMRVADILTILPEAEELFAQNGLHCGGCGVGGAETLSEAAGMHSMDDGDLDDLVTDLNILLSRRPDRPQTVAVTEAAADALKNILATESKTGWTLQVGLDDAGGFSMDIVEKPAADHQVFTEHGLTVSASPLTLKAIGGSTVDFRDGRFKLDLPGTVTSACACGGQCSCN